MPHTNSSDRSAKPKNIIYIIGTYPEVSTTFIDREIKILRERANINLKTISIRHPVSIAATLPEYKGARESTLYLSPTNWFVLVLANLYFIFRRPIVYFSTLSYLFIRPHETIKLRFRTLLYFLLGILTAYYLRLQDFDHIHVHFIDRATVVALVTGRLLNKTYSLTAHANDIFVSNTLIKEKISNAKFMVTVSKHNKSHLLENYFGLDPDKIHILHPWVDLTHFSPSTTRPTHERLHIFSVGRLVEKKGHAYLIEACHLLQQKGIDFECRIAGDGPLYAELTALVTQYNLADRVILLGAQPQREVISHLESWADVFVLACVIAKDGDRDGMPVSIAEAMAMELPVISTDIVGIGELVQPGTGFLTPDRDSQMLAEALQNIHSKTTTERAKMGQRGRTVIDNEFNLVKGTMELAHLFQDVDQS